MLNINEEHTLYPGSSIGFFDYMFGIGENAKDHDNPEDIKVRIIGPTVSPKIETTDREIMASLIEKEMIKSHISYSVFRCDFDFNLLPGEEPSFEEDLKLVEDLFQKYCRINEIFGYEFCHFCQNGAVDGEIVPLTKHIHLVYPDGFDVTFTDFLHKNII